MISLVCTQHLFKAVTILCSENRVKEGGVSQLYLTVSNLLDKERRIIKIYGITDLIMPGFTADIRLRYRFSRFHRFHSGNILTDLLQIVICKPFIVKIFCYTFRIYIVCARLFIPNGIFSIFRINDGKALIGALQFVDLCLFLTDCILLRQLFFFLLCLLLSQSFL